MIRDVPGPDWGDREIWTCPKCGRTSPVDRSTDVRWLRAYGWEIFGIARVQTWCGHAQEYVVLPPDGAGVCRLVQVVGEAS